MRNLFFIIDKSVSPLKTIFISTKNARQKMTNVFNKQTKLQSKPILSN